MRSVYWWEKTILIGSFMAGLTVASDPRSGSYNLTAEGSGRGRFPSKAGDTDPDCKYRDKSTPAKFCGSTCCFLGVEHEPECAHLESWIIKGTNGPVSIT